MRAGLIAFSAGLLFSIGLVVSGMVQPAKVKAFLDFFGAWDPSLAFVMVGAIATHFFAYRLVKKRSSPLFGREFKLPTSKNLDRRLILGAAIFGAGWGVAGFCPGPALTSLAGLNEDALIFVASMILGMGLFAALQKFKVF